MCEETGRTVLLFLSFCENPDIISAIGDEAHTCEHK